MTLRADAQRNLDALLGAATECFAEHGVDCSVDEIARRAGVGHGTVFRRFPTKDALLAAVLEAQMNDLMHVAEAALEEEDVAGAFEHFFRAAAGGYARNRSLVEAVKRCGGTPAVGGLMVAVGRLVDHAQAAGAVRKDVTAEDVLTLMPAASAYPDVILAGLRSPA